MIYERLFNISISYNSFTYWSIWFNIYSTYKNVVRIMYSENIYIVTLTLKIL